MSSFLTGPWIDRLSSRWAANPRAANGVSALTRAYLRYWPLKAGKPFVWTRIVEPYFAWQPHAFRARTRFGFDLDGDTRDLIQQWVYYFGIWEPALSTWIRRRLRRGDTFVDVGANIGYFALLASKVVGPSGRVVAIEASPRIFERLRHHAESNHAANLRTINAAAMGSRARVRLYRGNDANCGETTIVNQFGGELDCEIDGFPLHELLSPTELESARLIKIDTEGAEYSILAGMDWFPRLREDAELIVEVHPNYLAQRGESLDALLGVLAGHGFTPYVLHEEYWPPGYLENGPRVGVLKRLHEAVPDGTVLVFSRTIADVLR